MLSFPFFLLARLVEAAMSVVAVVVGAVCWRGRLSGGVLEDLFRSCLQGSALPDERKDRERSAYCRE